MTLKGLYPDPQSRLSYPHRMHRRRSPFHYAGHMLDLLDLVAESDTLLNLIGATFGFRNVARHSRAAQR